ncbi:upp-1 [Pristionchus pacificus]|uniref:Upp-1 n=1 Tax=Pristionchus pacificus TaxID=54126 RepID=A0A2A6BL62_PRIPA|nr:upp-1 [Pristionchus pacificus]|eukprot:PDM66546.1 upp-1 [Pristionchus pacificus]
MAPNQSQTTQVTAQNVSISRTKDDFLYHFGLSSTAVDMPKMFGDVKFVCAGGSASRSKHYAEEFSREIGVAKPTNLSRSDRFVIYKTGPVLWINHGMGAPSLSIMLIETLKLLHHAKAEDVCFVRLGTSGGVGVAPGSVVISTVAVNGELQEEYVQWIAGKRVTRPTRLCPLLSSSLSALAVHMHLPAVSGKTLCADDFYEGQMRLDGFFCEYEEQQKLSFLTTIHSLGVRNIEMESTAFAAITGRAGVRAAIVCVALLNRMVDDQVTISKELYLDYETRPFKLVSTFIRKQLKI